MRGRRGRPYGLGVKLLFIAVIAGIFYLFVLTPLRDIERVLP